MFYEATIKAARPDEKSGVIKEVTEKIIVENCNLFAEAELKLMERQECEVTALKRSAIKEFVNTNKDGENIFIATITTLFIDDNGKNKEISYKVALWANDITEAHNITKNYMRQGFGDMELKGINQTKFVELI